MTQREQMQALLAGESLPITPQWVMAVPMALARELVAPAPLFQGFLESPEDGAYPFSSLGEPLLTKAREFMELIDRCAFPVGWGAAQAFGHGGPGEFNKTVIQQEANRFVVEYETGARKEVRIKPWNVHTFYLPVDSPENLEALSLPDAAEPKRYAGFRQDVAWAKAKGLWTVGWVNGFFSGVHYFLRDYAEFLMDLLAEPEFAAALVDRLGQWNLEAVRQMCEAGVDCIGLCDDLGSEQSLLFSPELYREFFLPWHQKLCHLVHSYGAVVHLHSHGCILPLLPDLAKAGFDILNPLDPNENMPFDQVRELLGPKTVLCGGINKYFFEWPQQEQREHLRQVVAQGRRHGPHILMDSGGIPDNVSLEQFRTFLEMSREIRGQ